MRRLLCALTPLVFFSISAPISISMAGCGAGESAAASTTGGESAIPLGGTAIAADPQRPGDATKGYDALVNNAYISCGIPWSVYAQFAKPTAKEDLLAGRTGKNATLPYYFTAGTSPDGVEIVSQNCLLCHAGRVNGKLVVGLGAADRDFTTDGLPQLKLTGSAVTDPKEKAEWARWYKGVEAVAPYSQTLTIGTNPADSFTSALLSHRDRKTLAWSDEPLIPLLAPNAVPVDVPPWWRMSKKHAMFYNAGGRGDHARIEMTATVLCTDTVAQATAIDAYFVDVRAYIESLPSPAYPFPIDKPLADKGRGVFEATCSRCHGTYGASGAYPNLLIGVAEVGTDATLVSSKGQFAGDQAYIDWFNESFFGEKARFVASNGYVAPPLDGIWATAPYLHNGSVPTIAALLESGKRPKYWTRTFDSTDYDTATLGWKFKALDAGQDAAAAADRAKIYDTTKAGYGNGGHPFGDPLSAADRGAVIEYLKTL